MKRMMKIKKTYQRRPIKRQSLTAEVLKAIGECAEDVAVFSLHARGVGKYGLVEMRNILDAKAAKRRRTALYELKRQRLIALERTAAGYEAALTEDGRRQLFRLKVMESDLYEDGSACMVVFDIPERKRSLRKSLRTFLSGANFIPIQKSVWLSPFNATEPLKELFESNGARSWVRVFTVKDAGITRD